MADQPDPPDKWRVYEGDPTPDPEPPEPEAPDKNPYAAPQPHATTGQGFPTVVRRRSGAPTLILVMVAVAVLGVVVAAAVAIFAAVGGPGGLGGIDAKDPDDFEELIEKLEEERGSTEVFWVGLYTDYIIVDVPYTDDPSDTRELSYNWRGGDLDDNYSKGTSTDPRFDITEIDVDVIDGLCDPVLEIAEGADYCYIFISNPGEPDGAWFYTSASDEFNRSYSIQYDKNGNEVSRSVPE